MLRDRYNLKCALLGFILAGFTGFAFSAEFDLSALVDDCPLLAVHPAPPK